jgi:hypothetical protein
MLRIDAQCIGQETRGAVGLLFSIPIIAAGNLEAAIVRDGVNLHSAVHPEQLDDVPERFELLEDGGGHALNCLFVCQRFNTGRDSRDIQVVA